MKRTVAQDAKVGALVRMDTQDTTPEYRVAEQRSGHVLLAERDWERGGKDIGTAAVSDTAYLWVIEEG